MNLTNPNSSKVNFSKYQEVTYSDLNDVSTLLHNIVKDFNTQVINNPTGASPHTGLISGCGISLTSGPPYFVQIDPGVLLYNTGTLDSYTGTIVSIPGDTFSVTPPVSGFDTYYLDINYSEIPDSVVPRNKFNTSTNLVVAHNFSVSTIPQILFSLVPSPSSGPASGYFRFAQVSVYPTYAVAFYTVPKLWDMNGWPGTANTFDSDQIKTFIDSVSAVKAQLQAVLGPFNNWYSTPTTTLIGLATQLSTLFTNIGNVRSGFKSVTSIRVPNNGSSPFVVPSGVYRILIKMWGGGGGGGLTVNTSLGGRGGASGYLENIFNVTPGQTIPFSVGAGGSGSSTGGNTSFGPVGGVTAVAGGGGAGSDQTGVDGSPGVTSGGTFNVSISGQGVGGGTYRKIFSLSDLAPHFVGNGSYYAGAGGIGGAYTGGTNAGVNGADGLIEIFCE